jgi:hypothetical protein
VGGNGYCDIHSAPDWNQRAHVVLAGMKVYCHATAVNVDSDPYLEVYLTPQSADGVGRIMLIDYDAEADAFVVTDDLPAPAGTGGRSAIADFDNDGRVEILTGNESGYELLEYDGGLIDRGLIETQYWGNWACTVRPMPGEGQLALLGHSSYNAGFRYDLRRATGDNTFETVHVFQEIPGPYGIPPSFPLDSDNDGLQEFVMSFYPMAKIYEWQPGDPEFEQIWSWDQTATGTFRWWVAGDLDHDSVPEWCCLNHHDIFRAFEDQDAAPSSIVNSGPIGEPLRIEIFPNPFHETAEIRLADSSSEGRSGRLEIFDVRGRLIRSWTQPGRLHWDGRDANGRCLVSGAYFLRFQVGERSQVRRLVRM